MKIHVVRGISGIWNDVSWSCKAFCSLDNARSFVHKLNLIIDTVTLRSNSSPAEEFERELLNNLRELDPKAYISDEYVYYTIDSIDLDTSVNPALINQPMLSTSN